MKNKKTDLPNASNSWKICEAIFDVATKTRELELKEAEAAQPEFWDRPEAARASIAETNKVRAVVEPFNKICSALEDASVLIELAEMEEDEAQRDAAVADVVQQVSDAETMLEKLELQALLSGKLDANSAYLTFHAGAGGTESCDWADMLFRMYRRYAERHNFDVEILDIQQGDEAGIKSATMLVSGPYAYGYLKAERGVHRLVRISPFDSAKRRHTSFSSLDVVAEVDDDIDVVIEDKDLRVDTFRSSGAGGQHVNTTDSAIRLTHLPTGLVVSCQAERSQHKNRAKAMNMLRSQIYEYELDQQRKEMERFYSAKGEISWGGQMRSYVLQPYTMVKDLRTNIETGNTQAVLDGDLDMFIEGYLKHEARKQESGEQ